MYRPLGLLLFVVLGGLAGEARAQAASEISLDPLVSFITCMREAKPGYCIRERALGYFESWLTGEEDEDGPTSDQDEEQETGTKLSPYWNRMVDQVADRIAGFYGEEEEDEGKQIERRSGQVNQTEERQSTTTDIDGRNKKYKKDRRVKVAMTIILLIIYFIISQLFYMFDKFARTMIFAKLVLAFKVFILVKMVELKRYLWWVKEEKKEVHHEVSVHDHHWEEPEHFDHHYGHFDHHFDHDHHYPEHPPWGGWHSRTDPYRGYVPSTTPQPGR